MQAGEHIPVCFSTKEMPTEISQKHCLKQAHGLLQLSTTLAPRYALCQSVSSTRFAVEPP